MVVVGVGAHFKRGVAAQEELLLHVVKANYQTAHVVGNQVYATSTGQTKIARLIVRSTIPTNLPAGPHTVPEQRCVGWRSPVAKTNTNWCC